MHIVIHGQKRQRYKWMTCGKTFRARRNRRGVAERCDTSGDCSKVVGLWVSRRSDCTSVGVGCAHSGRLVRPCRSTLSTRQTDHLSMEEGPPFSSNHCQVTTISFCRESFDDINALLACQIKLTSNPAFIAHLSYFGMPLPPIQASPLSGASLLNR